MTMSVPQIAWGHDFEDALSQPKGKLVLLDFSAAPL